MRRGEKEKAALTVDFEPTRDNPTSWIGLNATLYLF